MYHLHRNFDKIKFPLALMIHSEFIKLKTTYLNVLKEQAL